MVINKISHRVSRLRQVETRWRLVTSLVLILNQSTIKKTKNLKPTSEQLRVKIYKKKKNFQKNFNLTKLSKLSNKNRNQKKIKRCKRNRENKAKT
jgi:hypothetical protein